MSSTSSIDDQSTSVHEVTEVTIFETEKKGSISAVIQDSDEQPTTNHNFKRHKLRQLWTSIEKNLREKGTSIINDAQRTVFSWTQAPVNVEENLSHTRRACKEMEEFLKIENTNMCEMLANEICLRNQREQESKEKESMLEKTKETLEKEKILRNRAEEELKETKSVSMQINKEMRKAKRKLRETEGLVEKLSQSLAKEERLRKGIEEELRKETASCSELRKELKIERLTNQSYQEVTRTKEDAFKVQQRQLEQEQKEKTTLESELSRLKTQMEVERNSFILTRSALSAAQKKLSEHKRCLSQTIPGSETGLGEKV